MRNSIAVLFIISLAGNQFTFGQGVNNIIIQPSNPTSTDTVFVVSDFSYYGNCTNGLVNAQIIQSGSVINIYPEYCGFGDSTLCKAVDTFSLGVLPIGNYIVNIEYHQGTVCAGNFDTIIANYDTTFQVDSPLSIDSIQQTDNKIIVYPNPTFDFIKIEHNEPISAINLFDMTGKELTVRIIDNNIDMRSLNSGLYLLNIQFENGASIIQKIIKNNAR